MKQMVRRWVTVGSVIAALGGSACRQQPQPPAGGTQTPITGLTKQDELILAAANVALPPPGIAAADLPDPNGQGAKLVATYCAQCHELPHPGMHSAVDWPGVSRRMWLRMEGLSPSLGVKAPSLAERFVMLEYLNANALKVSGATLPAGAGKEAFQLVCSRCHALPDPRVHSAADWPTVFARMETNMTRMKVPPLTGTQTTDILLYLQRASAIGRR
jgi:cytochrome c5